MADARKAALLRVADALLCGTATLLIEALLVGAWWHRELAGGYELALAVLLLVPLGVALAAPLLLGATALILGLERPAARETRWTWTVLAALLVAAVAIGVSGGRRLAGPGRPLFIALTTLAVAASAWWSTPRLATFAGRTARQHGTAFVAAVTLLVVLLDIANTVLLTRLYPAFHLGLAAITLSVAAMASAAWQLRPARPHRVRSLLGAGVLLLATAALVVAPAHLRTADNLRFVFLEHAPMLSYAVRLGAWLAPPPPLDTGVGLGMPHSQERAIDLSGRDVLIISVDALRADHVGAYGYERPTTPSIDGLAAHSVVFEAAYTATPHTSYAITSLMTGKYMRPLLLQGVGESSETLALVLRRYGYHTAAFFPPATFFVDRERFQHFEQRGLDFEYRKQQFASCQQVAAEVRAYLQGQPADHQLLLWAHLFEPHEPYVGHPGHEFGDRNIDRYDSEIAFADVAVGDIVAEVRAVRPKTVVIITADHGEEFGDHGGRYHGTTVYDEQVRVPLIVSAPGALAPRRVSQPVGLVDVMPTVLAALGIPVSPRVRGHDLGTLLLGRASGDGFAFAETDEQTLLAVGSQRLVCARRVGACRLFDLHTDPQETKDASAKHPEAFMTMKRRLGAYVASLGRYERTAAGRAWPRALRRGIAGDVAAAIEVAGLLDDADVSVRRKAAEVLFELHAKNTAPHLRRALRGDEDEQVRRWCALALTRLGQGAPLVFDLLHDEDLHFRRLAALALAEAGDDRGEAVLLGWWRAAFDGRAHRQGQALGFDRARQVAAALANIKSKRAVGPLGWALSDVRLQIYVARALAAIGDKAARPALGEALSHERYHDARVVLAQALVALGGDVELRLPLVRFLGVPDPLPGGLGLAIDAGVLRYVGGPTRRELERLRAYADSGVRVQMVVPEGGSGRDLRVIVRARNEGAEVGQIRFGLAARGAVGDVDHRRPVPRRAPHLVPELAVSLRFEPGQGPVEQFATLPSAVSERVAPGAQAAFVVYATHGVKVEACAVVPLADEIPPPPPAPWRSGRGGAASD